MDSADLPSGLGLNLLNLLGKLKTNKHLKKILKVFLVLTEIVSLTYTEGIDHSKINFLMLEML